MRARQDIGDLSFGTLRNYFYSKADRRNDVFPIDIEPYHNWGGQPLRLAPTEAGARFEA